MADSTDPPAVPAPRERKPKQATSAEHFKGRNISPDDNEAFLINYVRNATKKNIWYYRDRCGVARGPAPLPTLKEAWTHGLIDEYTLVWGQGLVDFLPIRNVRTLTAQIRTPEVRFATWVKKNVALKPALAQARKERGTQRKWQSEQVDRMR